MAFAADRRWVADRGGAAAYHEPDDARPVGRATDAATEPARYGSAEPAESRERVHLRDRAALPPPARGPAGGALGDRDPAGRERPARARWRDVAHEAAAMGRA